MEYIDCKDLRAIIRSKSDLWKRLTIDCKHNWFNNSNSGHLPSYSRYPILFMKQFLAGKKKEARWYWLSLFDFINYFRYIKNKHVVFFEIPDYPELGVKHVWPLVQENQELLKYFSDYEPSKQSEKDFMYGVLSTLKPDEVRDWLHKALSKDHPTLRMIKMI